MPTPRKNPARPRKLTIQETLLQWFQQHPDAKTMCNPLASKLKMSRTSAADGLCKLATAGLLHREKVEIPADARKVGEREFQYEYSLPRPEHVTQRRQAETFKPLSGLPRGYRRSSPAIESAPSIINVRGPQPEVGKNTGSLGRDVSDNSLPADPAVTQPPPPDYPPAAAGGDDQKTIPAPNYDPAEVCFDPEKRAAAWKRRAERAESLLQRMTPMLEALEKSDKALLEIMNLCTTAGVPFYASENGAAAAAVERVQMMATRLAPTLTAREPECFAVVAPKKPIQRFTARHNAHHAAAAAARTVGSAEIYGMFRIARASRVAVVVVSDNAELRGRPLADGPA